MTFLLDTDACVFWLRSNATFRERLLNVGPQAVSISIVTLAELRYGAACSARPDENQRAIDAFLSEIPVLGVDATTARLFGEIKAALRGQGALLEDADLFIAATARQHNLVLVTNNTAHFRRIPGLPLENWT